jgi:hypothetical protein
MKPNDTVRLIYRCEPWTELFWKTGVVTAVWDYVDVRFADGNIISCTAGELQKVRG